MGGQPAGVTEEPAYSAVLTRISRGVGSSTEEEEDEEEGEEEELEADEAADAGDVDVDDVEDVASVRPFLRLIPTRLAPATGAAEVSAWQRASVRVAARSRRLLRRRAGAEEEEADASKGKGMPPPKAWEIDGGALVAVAVVVAFFDAKERRADADAAESRDDIATVQLLSIKEEDRERSGRTRRRKTKNSRRYALDLDLLFS